MDGNGVMEVASQFERLAHSAQVASRGNALHNSRDTPVLNKSSGKLIPENGLHEFSIPRIEDLSSSSDESDYDGYHSYYTDHAMNSIAGAIQHDFLRAIPKAPKSPSHKSSGSAFDILNAKTGSQFRESSSTLKIPDKLKVRRASVSCVTNHDDSKNYDFLGSSKDDTLLLIQKKDCDRPPIIPKAVPKQHAILSTTDLPRNALVNCLGSIEITSDELRVLNLERSLLALKGCSGQFALLRVLGDGFSFQDCNEVNPSEPTTERKNRKKRYKKIGQSEAEDSGRAEDRKAQSKGVANILSCMKCVGPSRYQLLQHNNSINLKGYDVMKRKKKMIFFEYRKIIYSGVDIKGAPSNLLIWLYHIVSGSCTSVQCYAAECDDAQHARNLSRALGQQMATLR